MVIALFKRFVQVIRADAGVFTAFTRDDAIFTTYRTLHACDPAWSSLYASNGWAVHDPWLEYARHHTALASADRVALRTEAEQSMVQAAASFGFRSVVIVPAPSSFGPSQVGVLCLGTAVSGGFGSDELPPLRPVLRALAMELHDWCLRQLREELRGRARISEGDLVLLRHEAEGRGSKEIAHRMATRPMTIDCRFQRLNGRLGVATRRDAVRLARLYGLLD